MIVNILIKTDIEKMIMIDIVTDTEKVEITPIEIDQMINIEAVTTMVMIIIKVAEGEEEILVHPLIVVEVEVIQGITDLKIDLIEMIEEEMIKIENIVIEMLMIIKEAGKGMQKTEIKK